MSNKFLVRQILKAGGSLFVGASIAIGTLCPIFLNSSRALADSTWVGIPNDAATELQTLTNQSINPKTIAFTPDGGYAILWGKNSYYTNNIPQDALDTLATLNKQGSTINTIAFTPNGEWVIIYDNTSFYHSGKFPAVVLAELVQIKIQSLLDVLNESSSSNINSVTFTPDGEWVIIYNGNGFVSSDNFPQDVSDELATLNQQNSTINSVAFTPDGGWVILFNNYNSASNNIPQSAADAIAEARDLLHNTTNIAFTPDNGWVLSYQTLDRFLPPIIEHLYY